MKDIIIAAIIYLVMMTVAHTFIMGDWPPFLVFLGFIILSYHYATVVYDETRANRS